jgi:hypothetical protein
MLINKMCHVGNGSLNLHLVRMYLIRRAGFSDPTGGLPDSTQRGSW